MAHSVVVTEVPSSLKQLARKVVRAFYTVEDAFIVDMLVRNPCMKEDDLCELLKFERKMLRARIATLKNDKFIQVRLRMETGADGKAQKVNYYFINYKTFVNVVKYKLDMMRKRMETEERDATSRASFKCFACLKTFTDLEADQLFDIQTSEFRCTFCRAVVDEDQSALPKKDSRLLLAKFNEQLEPLYVLLRDVEGIRLAPEILEPEPVDINSIRGLDNRKLSQPKPGGETWSGEITRSQGFAAEETRVDVTITDESVLEKQNKNVRKERPIWMVESTINSNDKNDANISNSSLAESLLEAVATNAQNPSLHGSDDIMSVLLAHEKRNHAANAVKSLADDDSDTSSEELNEIKKVFEIAEVDSSDEEENTPTVQVGNRTILITDVDDGIISDMTPTEKDAYIQIYQEYYSHIYD